MVVNMCREWYSWHFPELSKIVTEGHKFAQLAKFIKNKKTLSEESLPGLEEIVNDRDTAQKILDAARASMGNEIVHCKSEPRRNGHFSH